VLLSSGIDGRGFPSRVCGPGGPRCASRRPPTAWIGVVARVFSIIGAFYYRPMVESASLDSPAGKTCALPAPRWKAPSASRALPDRASAAFPLRLSRRAAPLSLGVETCPVGRR
jgi:hypothetical protein